MTDTKRQRIFAAVVAQMRTIRTANGYQTDAGALVEEWQTHFDEAELPAISVFDMPESSETPHRGSVMATHMLPIQVRIFTRSNTPATELRKMIGDVLTAVGKDPRWGGLAIDTVPDKSGFVIPEDSFEIAGAAVSFSVEHMTKTFNPYE